MKSPLFSLAVGLFVLYIGPGAAPVDGGPKILKPQGCEVQLSRGALPGA